MIIYDKKTFLLWIEKIEKDSVFAINIETNISKNQQNILPIPSSFSFALQSGEVSYLPIKNNDWVISLELNLEKILVLLKPILENHKIKKIGYDLKYQYSILKRYEIELIGIVDIMLESYVINPVLSSHELKSLVQYWLPKKEKYFEENVSKYQKEITHINLQDSAIAATTKVDVILQLHFKMWPYLEKSNEKKNSIVSKWSY